MVIDKYEHDEDDEEKAYYRKRDVYNYLIEIIPGFNVFHFNYLKKNKKYLKINTLYHGFGRFSNCGRDAVHDNPDTTSEIMKRICCKGILEKIQINAKVKNSPLLITRMLALVERLYLINIALSLWKYRGGCCSTSSYILHIKAGGLDLFEGSRYFPLFGIFRDGLPCLAS